MAEKKIQPRYRVLPEYSGLDAWTIQPAYNRADGAKFTLDENISQTDLGYLFEVVNYPGVVVE